MIEAPSIGVVHPFLSIRGGAEAVSAAVVADLSRAGLRVTVISCDRASEARAAIGDLEPEFDDSLVTYRTTLTACIRGVFGRKPPALAGYALLLRELSLSAEWRNHFALISTYGEFSTPGRGAAYIHYPALTPNGAPSRLGGRLAQRPLLRQFYTYGARLVSGYRSTSPGLLVMTNSYWTKEEIQETMPAVRAHVLYPPVKPFRVTGTRPAFCLGHPLFVLSLGRLVPYKGQDRIVDSLHEAANLTGAEAEVVFVGRGTVADENWLRSLETKLVRVRVLRGVDRNRIGREIDRAHIAISAFQFEHFGIASAELMESGLPVLVPRGGGQVEVAVSDELLYDDGDDLVASLSKVLTDPSSLANLNQLVQANQGRFSRNRFTARLYELLQEGLELHVPFR